MNTIKIDFCHYFADSDEITEKNNIKVKILGIMAVQIFFENSLCETSHYENHPDDQAKLFGIYGRRFTRYSSTIDFLQEDAGKVTDDKAKCEIMYNFNSSAFT